MKNSTDKKIHIAICDDVPSEMTTITTALRTVCNESEVIVSTFSTSQELLLTIVQQDYDLVLLDIEMAEPNGFDTAKSIMRSPHSPLIIFITKNTSYIQRGYGVAFRYLTKPLDTIMFQEAIEAALCRIHADRLTLNCKEAQLTIPVHQIIYLESQGHYLRIHTINDTYKIRMRMDEAQRYLPRTYFMSPHKSYLVNAEYIASATASTVTMSSGINLPVSRNKRRSFDASLNQFLGM